MSNSTSSRSPVWPTRFAPDSFRPLPFALDIFGLVVLTFVVGLAGVAVFIAIHPEMGQMIARGQRPAISPTVAIGVQAVIDLSWIVYLLIRLPRLSRTSLRGLGFVKPNARTILIALLGAVAMVVIVDGLASVIETALHSHHQQTVVRMFEQLSDQRSRVMLAVFAVTLAPIAEELAFRVFLFNGFRKYVPIGWAMIASGVAFGALHADAIALVPLILGGIVLCVVYLRTRNAWASIITHGLFNASTAIALLTTKPPH